MDPDPDPLHLSGLGGTGKLIHEEKKTEAKNLMRLSLSNTGRREYSADRHVAPCTGLTFSPVNEDIVASCGLDKQLICYDLKARYRYLDKNTFRTV